MFSLSVHLFQTAKDINKLQVCCISMYFNNAMEKAETTYIKVY